MIRVFDDQMSVSAASSWPEERLQVCGKKKAKKEHATWPGLYVKVHNLEHEVPEGSL